MSTAPTNAKQKVTEETKIGPCARAVGNPFAVGLGVAPDRSASAPVGGRFRCHPPLRKKEVAAPALRFIKERRGPHMVPESSKKHRVFLVLGRRRASRVGNLVL